MKGRGELESRWKQMSFVKRLKDLSEAVKRALRKMMGAGRERSVLAGAM